MFSTPLEKVTEGVSKRQVESLRLFVLVQSFVRRSDSFFFSTG